MKHTHSFSESFQDKERRLIHLLEDGNPPLPAIEADGPEQKEAMDKPKTEKLDTQSTPEDVKSVGDGALADAEKGSTDLQGEVKKAQDDVNRIRLAAALGSGGLSAEEEHSAAMQRLEEAQAKALMEDHNPMSGGEAPPRELNLEKGIADATSDAAAPETTPPPITIEKTHREGPDTISEVEAVVTNVSENTDHVKEKEVKGGGGDDAGGSSEAPKGDDIEGDGSDPNFNYGPPTMEKNTEQAPEEIPLEPTGDIVADLRKAAEIYKNPEQRDKAFLFLIQALIYWIEGKKSDATSSAENAPASTSESQPEKGSEASTEQNDVIHGPARRARLINAYRAEEKKQPGMTATEFIAIKKDSIQKDEERLTEENDNLSKEEKNVKERVDILKSKRDSADPAARGPLETQIADAEKELKQIDAKIVANKDATEKLQDRKNDIVVLKELREKLKTLQNALKELPKDVLDNLNDAQRDVLKAFIKGVDAETYTVNFPTEDQINQLPTNAQDIIRNSTFYKQKDVYGSATTPAPSESQATTLPNPIQPSEAAKKGLEK